MGARREQVAAWVAELVGVADGVVVHEALPGATTATVWPVDGAGRQLVVKVYDLEIEGVGADDVRRDAAAMDAAEAVGIVAPRLVAADPDGARFGWPTIVMTRLPGRPRAMGRPDPDGWVDGLADALVAIATAPAPTAELPTWRPWWRLPLDVPDWVPDPGPWRAMEDALASSLPVGDVRFIHRDFHQLNVLWHDGAVVGAVDWVNGCVGPVESDLAAARLNIALAEDDADGFAHADRFLARCRSAGLPWDPRYDLGMVAGVIDATDAFLAGQAWGARLTIEGVRATLDEMVRRSLAEL